MRSSLVLAALAALAFASGAAAKPCKDAQGHFVRCPTAMVDSASPAIRKHSPVTSMETPASGGAAHCTTGKPCGGACIPMDKVCHK